MMFLQVDDSSQERDWKDVVGLANWIWENGRSGVIIHDYKFGYLENSNNGFISKYSGRRSLVLNRDFYISVESSESSLSFDNDSISIFCGKVFMAFRYGWWDKTLFLAVEVHDRSVTPTNEWVCGIWKKPSETNLGVCAPRKPRVSRASIIHTVAITVVIYSAGEPEWSTSTPESIQWSWYKLGELGKDGSFTKSSEHFIATKSLDGQSNTVSIWRQREISIVLWCFQWRHIRPRNSCYFAPRTKHGCSRNACGAHHHLVHNSRLCYASTVHSHGS